MRHFLTVLVSLSVLAVTQNVTAAAPASAPVPESEAPALGTMLLLAARLSGLTTVGSRRDERVARVSAQRAAHIDRSSLSARAQYVQHAHPRLHMILCAMRIPEHA